MKLREVYLSEDVPVDSLPDMGPDFPVQKQDIKNIQSVINKKLPDIVPFDNKALANAAMKKFPDATPGMVKNCQVISSLAAKKYDFQNPKPVTVLHDKRSGIGMCYHDYQGVGAFKEGFKNNGQGVIQWKGNQIFNVEVKYFDENNNRKVINATGSMSGKNIHTLTNTGPTPEG